MQPFDALTMRAALQEAKPLLLNRKIDKVYQPGKDEIILAVRLKSGPGHLLLSAQTSLGRLCLIGSNPILPKHINPPAFCQLLRKHLSGASVVDVEQIAGERVADFTFACVDELGTRSTKVLTAEIMGRHSNLIFWDKSTGKILGASHIVTQEMSRQREVAPNLKYVRPPKQDKQNIFDVPRVAFVQAFQAIGNQPEPPSSLETWLLTTFAGLGRHLADELIAAAALSSELPAASDIETCNRLWEKVESLQKVINYKPAMRLDLTRHTVLSWWPELSNGSDDWQRFPAVNDMVETYFRTLQLKEQLQQLKDRIQSELKSESDKVSSRLAVAEKQLSSTQELDQLKKFGDLVLINAATIQPGQQVIDCEDLYSEGSRRIIISLNPNLSPAQNAQQYYRQFAKGRVRKQAASQAKKDAEARLSKIAEHRKHLEAAHTSEELNRLKELILDRGKRLDQQRPPQPAKERSHGHSGSSTQGGKAPRLMRTKSTDGWLIYIGRNRNENDILLSRLAQPHDIWLHVQGQEGAHVLIKNPNKQDPGHRTLKEAAQLAARFSRISLGSKVTVIYTHCKYVRKLGKDKPGMVRYENERVIEIDTAAPMPASFRHLFGN